MSPSLFDTKQIESLMYHHAGYSYPSGATQEEQVKARRDNAEALARARVEALLRCWRFEWELDRDAETEGEMVCALYDAEGALLWALGGIDLGNRGMDAPYRLVIEAEIASEALAQLAP